MEGASGRGLAASDDVKRKKTSAASFLGVANSTSLTNFQLLLLTIYCTLLIYTSCFYVCIRITQMGDTS